jgi:hypothetical protein
MKDECPFCGNDPYHRVDIGVGSQPVAVNCCDLGIDLFGPPNETVIIDRETFEKIADVFTAMRKLGMSPDLTT